jgi:hypothetical protein
MLHQVGLADAAQDGGHYDVGHREIGAGDPLAVLEAPLDVAEPAAGDLAPCSRSDAASVTNRAIHARSHADRCLWRFREP